MNINPEIIGIAIIIIAIIIAIVTVIKWEQIQKYVNDPAFKEKVRELMIAAEKIVLTIGYERMEWVVKQVKLILPAYIAKYIPDDLIRDIIQELFDKYAVKCEDGHTRMI